MANIKEVLKQNDERLRKERRKKIIEEAIDQIPRYKLKELEQITDEDKEIFNSYIKYRIQTEDEDSQADRKQSLKFILTVIGLCALSVFSFFYVPKIFSLFFSLMILLLLSSIVMFIGLIIETIKSAIKKESFSFKEELLDRFGTDSPVISGAIVISFFVLLLYDSL
ncbi:MAG: hypothetical protein IJC81_05510 [Clostridia bacterium]|nr:hypothetical protein [Clostridia bacterium]